MDYSKTKIYKIESALGDKIYIGSTINKYLSQRFQLHISEYKRWKKGETNKTSSSDAPAGGVRTSVARAP